MVVKRFEVWLVNLDPTVGREIRKTRPCLVVSPDVANKNLSTITAAPMTSTIRMYPTRVTCVFQKRQGQIAIDQLRTLDKQRLVKKLGTMDEKTSKVVSDLLVQFFKY